MKLTKREFIAGTGAALVSATAEARSGSQLLHKCGAIEIRSTANGGVGIYGWKTLTPNPRPVVQPYSGATYVVTASFRQKVLEVHERDARGNYIPRIMWPVVTPDAYKLRGDVHGNVYQIDMRPEWYPSNNLRRKYNAYRIEHPEEDVPPLPYGRVPYGHPANPMGERKIRANWRGRYLASGVLHGTKGYPVELCGVETSGCVRIYNRWIVKLVDEVLGGPGRAVRAGTEVILTPRSIMRSA